MAAALIVCPHGAFSAPASGVEEEDIASQIASFRQILDEGNKHLASLDFPEAVDTPGSSTPTRPARSRW